MSKKINFIIIMLLAGMLLPAISYGYSSTKTLQFPPPVDIGYDDRIVTAIGNDPNIVAVRVKKPVGGSSYQLTAWRFVDVDTYGQVLAVAPGSVNYLDQITGLSDDNWGFGSSYIAGPKLPAVWNEDPDNGMPPAALPVPPNEPGYNINYGEVYSANGDGESCGVYYEVDDWTVYPIKWSAANWSTILGGQYDPNDVRDPNWTNSTDILYLGDVGITYTLLAATDSNHYQGSANQINEAGVVAGQTVNPARGVLQACYWEPNGTCHFLDAGDGVSAAWAISDNNTIAVLSSVPDIMVFEPNGTRSARYDLSELNLTGSPGIKGISDNGVIVGEYWEGSDPNSHGFVIDPNLGPRRLIDTIDPADGFSAVRNVRAFSETNNTIGIGAIDGTGEERAVLIYYNVGEVTTCEEVWMLGGGLAFDLNQDCWVDLKDMGIFVQEWLSCNDPNNAECN